LSYPGILASVVAAALLASIPSRHAGVAALSTPAPASAGESLLATSATSDIVSPAGVDSVLCSLAPVMSRSAQAEVVSALRIACGSFAGYSPVSVWLEQGPSYRADAIRALERHAEVFVRPIPLNGAIAAWVARRGGIQVRVAEPLRFAAVGVLVYARAWRFPINQRLSKRGTFHGRDRETTVTFMTGVGATVVHAGMCEQTSIPLDDGGQLRLAAIRDGMVSAALQCIARTERPGRAIAARYTVPRLLRRGQNDLTSRLKRMGITKLFSAAAQPFPNLERGLKLDEVLQATEIRVDETGVGVRATTVADAILGAPRVETTVVFDRPFALEVVDNHRAVVAIGVINDL
jgi:hypothetical protein